jgi:hypothetical protein
MLRMIMESNAAIVQNQLRYSITKKLLESLKPVERSIEYLKDREMTLRNCRYICDICGEKIEGPIIEIDEWNTSDFGRQWERCIPDNFGKYHQKCANERGLGVIKMKR